MLPTDPPAENKYAKGGHARAASLDPETRTDIARKAAEARWNDRKTHPSPLCAAVRRVRETLGVNQADFARLIRTTPLFVARFEAGIMEPRRLRILHALEREAMECGLLEEAELFAQPRSKGKSDHSSQLPLPLPKPDPLAIAWIGTI